MEIIKAKNAGFCFGVKRAIDAVYEELGTHNKIYCIGPLIHNEEVIKDLEKKGLITLNKLSEINKLVNEVVVIRTHGIEKGIIDKLISNGNRVIDLTCPYVKKIHNFVKDYSKKGYKIIVIGDEKHPEVKGIVSYSISDIKVINSEDEIKKLDFDKKDKVLIVLQTTSDSDKSKKLVDILKDLFYNYSLEYTICNATENRQKEVASLSKECDVMLIIGSKTSSNTKKLFEISKKCCQNTYMLSNYLDFKQIIINKDAKVGVSAGASTPEYLIEEILENVRNEF